MADTTFIVHSDWLDSLKELLDTNEKAIVLNAGTPMGLGFVQGVRDEYVKSTILPKNIWSNVTRFMLKW